MTSELEKAAGALGLDVTSAHHAVGAIAGRRVTLDVHSGNKPALTVRVRLTPPLDLGLGMRRREITLLGAGDVTTGDAHFDGEFSLSADEPERVARLFAAPLREHLLALHGASYDISLDDGGCTLSQQFSFFGDGAWLVDAARAAADVVGRMDEARRGLRAAGPLAAHAEALRLFSAARGLDFTTAPLSAGGRLDDRPVRVRSKRTGRGDHHLIARAYLEVELGLSLLLRRERLFDGLRTLLGGQDVAVGDEAFDRRFLVRAEPARAARIPVLLDREVRVALLEIDGHVGPVTIDDHGISVDPIPADLDPEHVVWMLDALAEVATRLGRNLLHGGDSGSPYR